MGGAYRRRRRQPDREPEPEKPEGPYGYVLTLRTLAAAAIIFGRKRPLALGILCVLAEYTNKDGECRVSTNTLADRFRCDRANIIKALGWLKENDWVLPCTEAGRTGKTARYLIPQDYDEARAGQHDIDAGRKRRREQRQAGRHDRKPSQPRDPRADEQSAPPAATPSGGCDPQRSHRVLPPEVTPGVTSTGHTRCDPQRSPEETLSETDVREGSERGAGARPPFGSARAAPERVWSKSCGPGTVLRPAGAGWNSNTVVVQFDSERGEIYIPRDLLRPLSEFETTGPEDGAFGSPRSLQVGTHVHHDKFGAGTVAQVDGHKLKVSFVKAGEKTVLDDFITITGAAA